jgi:hypothetical protein
MPHKAQLLLQLAQAAAKVERQQGVLPSVAVNVWDTISGTHAAAQQQPAANTKAPLPPGATSASDHRLPGGFGSLMHFPQHTLAHPAANSHAQQLLAQQAAVLHHWGIHPGLTGNFAADTAVVHDNGWGIPQHSLPAPFMHAAGIAGLPRPGAAARFAPRSQQHFPVPAAGVLNQMQSAAAGQHQQQQQQQQQQLGGARKTRFNTSISLNKQIMNTHSTRDLHTIVRSKGSSFDFFNISSAIARVPKLVGTSNGVQVRVAGASCRLDFRKSRLAVVDTLECSKYVSLLVLEAFSVGPCVTVLCLDPLQAYPQQGHHTPFHGVCALTGWHAVEYALPALPRPCLTPAG